MSEKQDLVRNGHTQRQPQKPYQLESKQSGSQQQSRNARGKVGKTNNKSIKQKTLNHQNNLSNVPDIEYDGGMDDMEPLMQKDRQQKQVPQEDKSSCIEDQGIQVTFRHIQFGGQGRSTDEDIKQDQNLHEQYFDNGHKPPSLHKITDSGDAQTRTEVLSDNWFLALKIIFVSIITLASIIMNILTIMNDTIDDSTVDGVYDKSHDLTTPLNQYFGEDLSRRDTLLIVNAILIDLLIVTQGIRLIFRGTTFRFFLANALFYSFRLLQQYLYTVQTPKEGNIWGYPGIPSLFLQYGDTTDFFYSGQTGHLFMEYLEFSAVGWSLMSYFSLVVMFFNIFVVIITRSHYCIDIMGGLIFGHLFWILGERYIYLFDYYLLAIPLTLRLGNDEKTIEAQRIEESFKTSQQSGKQNENDSQNGLACLQLKDAQNLQKFKKTNAYLRCMSCDNCVGQYVIYREAAVHAPNEQDDFKDFEYKVILNQ